MFSKSVVSVLISVFISIPIPTFAQSASRCEPSVAQIVKGRGGSAHVVYNEVEFKKLKDKVDADDRVARRIPRTDEQLKMQVQQGSMGKLNFLFPTGIPNSTEIKIEIKCPTSNPLYCEIIIWF